MWKMSGKPKVLSLTPQLAKTFRDMTPAPGDRPLRDRRVESLKQSVISGQFRTCEWASAYCAETKQTYRVNGKHTSTLMAELNGEAKGVSVVVEHYHCDTLDDVALLYSTFDTRSSARSTGDINAIFAGSCEDLSAVPLRVISTAVTGMAIAMYGESDLSNKSTPNQRAALLRPNADFVLWLHEMTNSANGRMLKRGPVAAAMFATFQKDRKAACEFWLAVRDATGTKPSLPDRRLNALLLTCRISSVNGGRDVSKKAMSGRELRVKCIHAWNAWRRGAVTDLKYFANADDPKVI